MNQSGYILQAVNGLFASSALAALVPGGMSAFGQRADSGAAPLRPFGQISVEPSGGPEFTTGKIYAQDYEVRIEIWSDQAVGDAAAIQTAMEMLLPANTKLAGLVSNAWTLHISREPAIIREESERFLGQFTFVAAGRWTVQLQEQRN